jgi:hypothetical protein
MSDSTSKKALTDPHATTNTTPNKGHRNTPSIGSTAITRPQMTGTKLHPALRDLPTGRHILSGKQRDYAYMQNIAMLKYTSVEARDVQDTLLAMVAWADMEGTLDEAERRELASTFSFPSSCCFSNMLMVV